MMPVVAWLKRLLAPPVFIDDEEKTRSARVLNAVLWTLLLGWILTLPLLLGGKQPALGGGFIASLVLVAAACLQLLRLGYGIVVQRLVVLLAWVAAVGLLAFTGGLSGPAVTSFIVLVLVAGVLGRARLAVLSCLLSLGSMAAVYALQQARMLPASILDPASSSAVLLTSISILTASGLIYITLDERDRATTRIQQDEMRLANSNENFQALMSSLEYVAEERTRSAEDARQEMEAANERLQEQIWQTSGLARLNERMSGEQEIAALADIVLHELCQAVDAQVGALFLLEDSLFRLVGSYAFMHRKAAEPQFRLGEGLAGQAAFERKVLVLHDVPAGYLAAHSGMLELTPRQVTAAPFSFSGQVLGVVELASMEEFTPSQVTFIQRALESVGVAFGTAQSRRRVDELLVQTQQQASQLQQREESLRAVNEELQAQAETLRSSQDKLRQQQAHLEAANVELEEKTDALQQQRTRLDQQNRELLAAQEELQRKAEELQGANRYKSEFLANMSHELRTPLNSLLILARMLADNEPGNLTDEQVKSVQVIYNSGSDLLKLINDILDLSKVEAGRMEFYIERTSLAELVEGVRSQFEPIANERGVPLVVSIDSGLPGEIETDPQRLRQVIKNLLANAFKFTERGQVTLHLTRPQPGTRLDGLGLDASKCIAFKVQDTGIGIPKDQQAIIFEAFQQADGSTNRKYGGTGLGLAIAREMVLRLGGYIDVSSVEGEGSLFTIVLPEETKESPPAPLSKGGDRGDSPALPAEETTALPPHTLQPSSFIPHPASLHAIKDDRQELKPSDRLLLVVDDDPHFASVVQDFAHQKGFKCLLAPSGESALDLAVRYPPHAIILDLHLPGMSGWEVLDALKRDAALRHIPVHIMSVEDESMQAYQRGVLSFLTKPVSPDELGGVFQEIEDFISRRIKSLLLVEDDEDSRQSIIQLLGGSDLEIVEAASGKAAVDLLQARSFDCMILDLSLPDVNGFDLLESLHQDEQTVRCPIIVYTGRALNVEENRRLMQYADSVIVKGVKSPERLLDETALFLHRVVADLPVDKQRAIQKLYRQEEVLRGKKILVVDDDMRNSFALSRLLNDKGMLVEIAANGQKALEMLDLKPDFDLVLMDVMMPVLDGLETTRRIRLLPQFRKLPILALTAKAMKGDREKCLEAGANDYLSKPVDADRLFSMLRVWLYNR